MSLETVFKLRSLLGGPRREGRVRRNVQSSTGRGRGRPNSYDSDPWSDTPSAYNPFDIWNQQYGATESTSASPNNQILDIYREKAIRPYVTIVNKEVEEHADKLKTFVDGVLSRSPRWKTYAAVALTASALYQTVPGKLSNMLDWYIDRSTVCLRIPEDSEMYPDVRQFINEKVPPRARRSGTVKTDMDINEEARYVDHASSGEMEEGTPKGSFSVFYDLDREDGTTFEHDGQLFFCTKEEGALVIRQNNDTTEKIEEMLSTIHKTALENKQATCVKMYRAQVDYQCFASWAEQKSAKTRNIDLVCLEPEAKQRLLEDLDDYCGNAIKCYSRRGIPMRRGVLLHGPPGTGKTSLIQAVASRYNLTVRILSISSPGMTDEGLVQLFKEVGRGTLLVLEDIDCAGITTKRVSRPTETDLCDTEDDMDTDEESIADENQEFHTATESGSVPQSLREHSLLRARPQRRAGAQKKNQPQPPNQQNPLPPSTVTLSGLLNVIDGLNSPEGHILFMTSNFPENLDEALTRPGRIELQIKLDFAGRTQLRDLFLMIYMPIDDEKPPYDAKLIPSMSEQFAEMVPERGFSAAEVTKGYLIIYRVHPQRALDGVPDWLHENRRKLKRRGVVVPRLSAKKSVPAAEQIGVCDNRRIGKDEQKEDKKGDPEVK